MKKADREKTGRRRESDRAVSTGGVMPQSDPAFPIVSGILGVVPASRWPFARVEPNGELVSLFGSEPYHAELPGLTDEFKRQRTKSRTGPRIAATLGSLDDFESGITLLFADARADFGILTLLRTAELGPFTSSEISVLTFALDAVSDRLSALRLQPPSESDDRFGSAQNDGAPGQPEGAFYVLDGDLQIVLAWSNENRRRVAHGRLVG